MATPLMPSRRTLLGASLALATMPSAGWAKPRGKIRLGIYSDTIFFLPFWIADEKGFFDKAGVDVELVSVPTMKLATEAMLDGSEPIAMLGPELAFLDRHAADRVRIIAGNANRPPHFLIAQSRFKSVADLKGATFGVISLDEGTTYLVQRMAAAAGLKPGEYRIEAVGSAPTRARLLEEGKIDAGLQPFPLSYIAESKGFSNLGWVGKAEPDWQFSVMLANKAWLAKNRDTAARFVAACVRGRHYMDEHPDAAAEIAARHIHTTLPMAKRALDDALRLGVMDRSFGWSDAGLKAIYETMQHAGTIPADRPFRALDYIDPQPLFGRKTPHSI